MKKILLTTAIALSLALPMTAFAATSDTTPASKTTRTFCGADVSNLTDKQKADLEAQFKKMTDLRKETINKMVENGTLTKEQGETALKRIDEMIKYHEENGFTGGFGKGRGFKKGFAEGRGMMGRGMMGGGFKAICPNVTPSNS